MIKTRKTIVLKFFNDWASAELIIWKSGRATIGNLYSRKRGFGYGAEVMKQITDFCDDNDITLGLWPDSYGPGSGPEKTKELHKFYKKFGFKNNGHRWLVRKPSQK